MRTPTGAGLSKRLLRAAVWSTVFVAGTGCATVRSTFGSYATGPDGIARSQQRLREALVTGDFPRALAWREDDALLQALTTGISAYHAKQFARSAAVLDSAALLADDRITASLSKNGLSLVTNDMARPYQPRRTERLFIPYYAMLSYAQLGEWEDAAVEARRLVGLLAQYGDDRDDAERGIHGVMQQLSGAVFERAGERDGASVAYRAAQALTGEHAPGAARAVGADEGEVLLVMERGFVAHRATETMEIWLGDDDRDSLRLASHRKHGAPHAHHGRGDGYHLKVAFPSLRRSAQPWGGSVRLAVEGAEVSGNVASSVVDDASEVDARRERVALITRSVARAVTKYGVTKAIKDKKGEVAGRIANVGASLLERADVRSWHLLPQELTLVRTRMPAGTRALHLQLGEGWAVRSVDVGSVTVRRGELTIVPVRLWTDPPPGSIVAPPAVIAETDGLCPTHLCP